MVEKKDIEAFKNELKNLTYYKKKIKEVEERIEVLEYDMQNVKGVNYTKQQGTPNLAASEKKKLAMSDKLERLQKEKKKWVRKERELEFVLGKMEKTDRHVVERAIVNGEKYRDLCDEFGIKNTSSLYNAVNNAIADALKKARI